MTIDFAKVAKKVAQSALVAMGTGVFGMIGGGLVKLGLGALDKTGGPAELPDTNVPTDAIDTADETPIEVPEVDVPEVQADVDVELPEGDGA